MVAVLGAGASWPHIPTTENIPRALRKYALNLGSYSASPMPDLPIRRLLGTASTRFLDERAALDDARVQRFTGDSIALALQQIMAAAHRAEMPQYKVFGLVPSSASVVSFNWDGLAKAMCPQACVIHPHGSICPVHLSDSELAELLESTQFADDSDGKLLLGRSFVLIGEEDSSLTAQARVAVGSKWLSASSIVVVGYSFGLEGNQEYDAVWREQFIEDVKRRDVPVHLVSPDAVRLREILCAEIGRSANVYAWPLSWFHFARAVLAVAADVRAYSMLELVRHESNVQTAYARLLSV